MQDRISQVDEKLLQRTAGPYIGVNLSPKAQQNTIGSGPEWPVSRPKINA
jgi:hypothetical protein